MPSETGQGLARRCADALRDGGLVCVAYGNPEERDRTLAALRRRMADTTFALIDQAQDQVATLNVLRGCWTGIAAPARHQLAHRDLKPESVFVTAASVRADRPLLADSGTSATAVARAEPTGGGCVLALPRERLPEFLDRGPDLARLVVEFVDGPLDDEPSAAEELLAARGEAIYQGSAEELERTAMGKVVAIEVDSGQYYIGRGIGEADELASRDHPGKLFYFRHIGPRRLPAAVLKMP
ncbi:MAG: hypothetical protein QME96_16625 [Myxococcota bacterium]|nr:hypothetical protein [Myxococcota bacterium]